MERQNHLSNEFLQRLLAEMDFDAFMARIDATLASSRVLRASLREELPPVVRSAPDKNVTRTDKNRR
jgi:hypothetical protein